MLQQSYTYEVLMRAALRKLGNSSGVIIPKSLLRDLGMAVGDPVEMTLEAGRIILIPMKRRARADWAEASQGIAKARDDALVWPEFGNVEDKTLIW
jgi:antitoxin MazE